jgi:transcriptional regulator with XRE-family HTH domain
MGRAIANQPLPHASTRIRELRIARNWSQQDLADHLIDPKTGRSMTRQTAQRWETDDRDLTLDKLEIVARAFGVPRRDLLPEGDGLSDAERALVEWHRTLAGEDQAFLAWFREASPADRRPVLALKHGLHDRGPDAFTVRPASSK